MDAASNNSVDDIRDLREKVAYAPVSGRHKVYILDEAHMLSTAAWNAFLKTLEEPPPHTIFVLATTEANKVLPTVVDRCHRFDFARPTQQQIAGVLRRVADAEAIEIPDEAIALIARSATGSFRDALGTLEQLVSYSGASVTLEDVLAVLGAADADLLFGAVDAVDAGDARAALLAAARLADSGRDVGRFFGDLEAHLRGLMIVQTLGEVPGGDRASPPSRTSGSPSRPRRVGPAAVLRLLDLVANALRAMKDGADPRTQLELALVKAARPEHDPSLRALMARLERLEAGRPAAAPARGAAPPARAAGRPPPTAGRPGRGASRRPRRPPSSPPPSSRGRAPVTAVVVVEPDGERAEPEVRVGVELDLPGVAELWPAVLADVQERSPMLHALIEDARPSALAGGELTLTWAESAAFYKRKAEDPGLPRADRHRDPQRHRQLAAPRLRPRRRRRAPRERRGAHPVGGRAHRHLHARVRRRGASSRRGVLMPQPPNLGALLQQAQKMQEEMMAAQEKLKDEPVEASAGGGMVKVVMSGDLELKSLAIDPDAVDPEDVEMLQDMVWPPSTRRCARRWSCRARRRARAAWTRPRPWTCSAASAGWAASAAAAAGCPAARRRTARRGASRGSHLLAPPVQRLVTELGKLPGIGNRTAQRLAFHLLRVSPEDAYALADAIREVKDKIGLCEVCFNLAEGPRCTICQDERRDPALICVVEEPGDVIPVERTHEYRGRYHVLGGALSPIDGVEPEDLKIAQLYARVERADPRSARSCSPPTPRRPGRPRRCTSPTACACARPTWR